MGEDAERMKGAKEAIRFETDQERFWAGSFGDEYARRNRDERMIVNNVALFAKVLGRTRDVRSILEFGANIGLNLKALRQLCPDAALAAVEINRNAARELERWVPEVHESSILDFKAKKTYDFVLAKGILIHINPDKLPRAYEALVRSSARYLCVVEYYNPTPVEVPYRGHQGKLFKRDFAGEILDRYPEMELVDYGFVYRRDPQFPMDDATWFLLKKGRRP